MPTTASNKPATSMADLLKSVKTPFKTFHKGDAVEGKITKLTSSEILVDIGAKAEAVVLEKDKRLLRGLLEALHVGDTVTVSILNVESEYGNPVVSLRRFTDDKMWEKLTQLQRSGEQVSVTVMESTKGGFVVSMDTVSGFLPNSHLSFTEGEQHLVGKTLRVVVLEVNRPLRKIIFSQKGNMSSQDFKDLTKEFTSGQKITATITNVTPFGIFLMIQNKEDKSVEGMVHVSEVSWEKVEDLPSLYTAGQTLEGEILGFDRDSRRVNVSLKRLTSDPRVSALQAFTKDQKVKAVVEKVMARGVTFHVPSSQGDIEGFMKKVSIPPTTTYTQGQEVSATISDIDMKNHRLVLSPVLLEKPIGYR